MSAEFESGFFVRNAAWHRLGNVVQEAPKDIDEALRLAGLDWDVALQPTYLADGRVVDGSRAVVRSTDGAILGAVGDRYRPLQNRDAMAWFEPWIASGAVALETAGSLKGGRHVWALARVNIQSASIASDTVQAYLWLANSHDGSASLTAKFTNVVVVCANTWRMAMADKGYGRDGTVRLRHTRDMQVRLDAVRATVDLARRRFESQTAFARRMAKQRMSVAELGEYVREVLRQDAADVAPDAAMAVVSAKALLSAPTRSAGERESAMIHVDRSIERIPRAFAQITANFTDGVGAVDRGQTLWGGFNSITEWVDHQRGREGTRLLSAMTGAGDAIKSAAWDAAVARVA